MRGELVDVSLLAIRPVTCLGRSHVTVDVLEDAAALPHLIEVGAAVTLSHAKRCHDGAEPVPLVV